MLRASATVLLVAAALVAPACGGGEGGGGGEGAAPEQYAADVCGALTTWQNELQTSASTMSSTMSASSSPADVKAKLGEFMGEMTKSTDKLVSTVEAAGPPAVEDGEALHRDLVDGLKKAQQAFADAQKQAEALPTDDPSAFQQQASTLSTTLTEQGTAIGSTFQSLSTKYDSQELNEAFNSQAACTNLQ